MSHGKSSDDLRSRIIERMKALGANEEMANKFYDGDQRFSLRAATLRGQALEDCLIEDQGRIVDKLQSLSEGQEDLVKGHEDLRTSSNRQNRTIITLTTVIIMISVATFVLYLSTALHWL